MFPFSVPVTEVSYYAFQEGFGVCHIVVFGEDALCGDVGECEDGGAFGECVQLPGVLKQSVQGDGGDFQGFLVEVVVNLWVFAFFSDVHGHGDGVEDPVEWSARVFHSLLEEVVDVFIASQVCGDEGCVELFCQLTDFSHTCGKSGVGEDDACSPVVCGFGDVPGNGLFV